MQKIRQLLRYWVTIVLLSSMILLNRQIPFVYNSSTAALWISFGLQFFSLASALLVWGIYSTYDKLINIYEDSGFELFQFVSNLIDLKESNLAFATILMFLTTIMMGLSTMLFLLAAWNY